MEEILILDFGGQYCHLISRRLKDLGVNSKVMSYDTPAESISSMKPKAIILSGGPAGVFEEGAPHPDKKIFTLGIPILGICYGEQLIAHLMGGKVEKEEKKEFGKKMVKIEKESKLFSGLNENEQAWFSHGDTVTGLPKHFVAIASSDICKNAAIENASLKIYGVQFHPEVVGTPSGNKILENFLFSISGYTKNKGQEKLAEKLVEEVKSVVGKERLVMGVSGGVDSTTAAALIHSAIGERLHCVLVDSGLMRKNEISEIEETYRKQMKFENFHVVDARKKFLDKLKGVTDPEEKRKIIGFTFIEVFEEETKKLEEKFGTITFLGQGTIYPDRIESANSSKTANKIKSHHNLTLPEKMKLKLCEPLKDLYKDEVREIAKEIGIPNNLIDRHPFPGPALSIRILGEVTEERLAILREADHIFIQQLRESGEYMNSWQAFAALIPVKAVGVKGDARTYEYIITLRAVTSRDGMTADWTRIPYEVLEKSANKILNEVRGVARVLYDISQKPPSTIEYL